MNWYKIFYWISVADTVKEVSQTFAIIGLVATIASIIGWIVSSSSYSSAVSDYGNDSKPAKSWDVWTRMWKRLTTTMILLMFVAGSITIFCPSKKDAMVIIAGGAIGNFVSTDSSSKAIPAELTKYVRNYLKKNAEDLDYETKKELGVETPKETLLNKIKKLSKEQAIEYIQNDTTLIK